MKKNQIATGLITGLIALVSTDMYAEDCCMPSYQAGEALCSDDVCFIYSAYAGTQLNCGFDMYGFGEFLYWKPLPNPCVDVASFREIPTGFESNQLNINFGYRPGFRIGVGIVLHNFDDWILNADYTRYHNNFKKTFSADLDSILASTFFSPFFLNPIYSSIKDQSVFNYDVVGLNLQRPNYLGQRVILSPFFGLKWMDRTIKFDQDLVNAFDGQIDILRSSEKLGCIGIAAGFDGVWLMCWGFRMIGKADVAALYAYKHKSLVQTVAGLNIIKSKTDAARLNLLGKGGMGLGWGSYLFCNRYYMDVSATYDYYADVNKGDFVNMFCGLTVRAQLDF